MKNNPTGEAGNKKENTPKTLNIAPDAPNEATDKDDPKNIGIANEANEEITAEFKYMIVKLDTPKNATKVEPND